MLRCAPCASLCLRAEPSASRRCFAAPQAVHRPSARAVAMMRVRTDAHPQLFSVSALSLPPSIPPPPLSVVRRPPLFVLFLFPSFCPFLPFLPLRKTDSATREAWAATQQQTTATSNPERIAIEPLTNSLTHRWPRTRTADATATGTAPLGCSTRASTRPVTRLHLTHARHGRHTRTHERMQSIRMRTS